jgi:hypothetical protein
MTEGAQLGRGGLGIVQLQPAMLRNWRPRINAAGSAAGLQFYSAGLSLAASLLLHPARHAVFLAVASVAFWCCSTHRLPPCLCPAQLCTSIIPPAQLDENGSVPTTIITSHAPRTPTLRPPRSCSDSARRAGSPWNRAAESSRCLAATSPDAAILSRPSTHLSHQAHRNSRIDAEPSTAPG